MLLLFNYIFTVYSHRNFPFNKRIVCCCCSFFFSFEMNVNCELFKEIERNNENQIFIRKPSEVIYSICEHEKWFFFSLNIFKKMSKPMQMISGCLKPHQHKTNTDFTPFKYRNKFPMHLPCWRSWWTFITYTFQIFRWFN